MLRKYHKQIKYKDWHCDLRIGHYTSNPDRVAITLTDSLDGIPVATCTVNIPEEPLGPDEVIIKNYGGQEGMSDALQQVGIIGPELRRASYGYVTCPVHKLLININEL